jgi:EPS-associated MarR family transcriptional regulator
LQEIHYRILRHLERNPGISQRELSREMGVSVGKVNYCINALVQGGLVKIRNFRSSSNKLAYAYVLTPQGVAAKGRLAVHFLQRKVAEYEELKREIERLSQDVQGLGE